MDFQRSRARTRHHHPRQGDLAGLEGHPHQHRRHPRPRRFRRRGGAHPVDGGWRGDPRRRRRRPDAADQVRAGKALAQGLRPIVAINKIDRPDERHLEVLEEIFRSLHRARRHARAARFPGALRRRQAGLDGREARGPQGSLAPLLDKVVEYVPPAQGGRGPVPHAGHHHRAQPVPRPHPDRPHLLRLGQGRRSRHSLGRDGKVVEKGRISKVLAFRGLERTPIDVCRGRRHRRHCRPRRRHRCRHAGRPVVTVPLPLASRSIRRPCRSPSASTTARWPDARATRCSPASSASA
jgi:hypothetical protein